MALIKPRFFPLGYYVSASANFRPTSDGVYLVDTIPESKVHGANTGPIWGRQDPGVPHVDPMNLLSGMQTAGSEKLLYELSTSEARWKTIRLLRPHEPWTIKTYHAKSNPGNWRIKVKAFQYVKASVHWKLDWYFLSNTSLAINTAINTLYHHRCELQIKCCLGRFEYVFHLTPTLYIVGSAKLENNKREFR